LCAVRNKRKVILAIPSFSPKCGCVRKTKKLVTIIIIIIIIIIILIIIIKTA